jgi:hypothetical protein
LAVVIGKAKMIDTTPRCTCGSEFETEAALREHVEIEFELLPEDRDPSEQPPHNPRPSLVCYCGFECSSSEAMEEHQNDPDRPVPEGSLMHARNERESIVLVYKHTSEGINYQTGEGSCTCGETFSSVDESRFHDSKYQRMVERRRGLDTGRPDEPPIRRTGPPANELDDLRCPDCGAVDWYYQINEAMDDRFDPGETYYYTRRVSVSRRQDGRLDVVQSFDGLNGWREDEIALDQPNISCSECNNDNCPRRVWDIVDAALAHFGEGEEGEYVVSADEQGWERLGGS